VGAVQIRRLDLIGTYAVEGEIRTGAQPCAPANIVELRDFYSFWKVRPNQAGDR